MTGLARDNVRCRGLPVARALPRKHDVGMANMLKGFLGVMFVLLVAQMSGCTEPPQPDERPVVIHAEPPNQPLMPDWDMDAIQAAWDAACPEGADGEQSWTPRRISPPLNDAGTVIPDKMAGTAECADSSRHEVIIVFDRPVVLPDDSAS